MLHSWSCPSIAKSSISTVANPTLNQLPSLTFSSEMALDSTNLDRFWQQISHKRLTVNDGVELAYCWVHNPASTKAIVISSGRVETYLKYKELIYDLYQLGYSIYAIDHRGQGLSSRTTHNPHQGHIDRFDDYVKDFSCFIDTIVKPAHHHALYLVGHSMGGTIGTLYIQHHPATFKAAVFSAPMYGIVLPANRAFIHWLAKKLDNDSSSAPNYVLGGKDYSPDPFEKNDLTNSQHRYDAYRALYAQQPSLQLGSPTNRWLWQAIEASEQARTAAKNSTVPILILQADQDTIVDNRAQDRAAGKHCQLVSITDARHEIFMESDQARTIALKALMQFLDEHTK
nr:alpha/beta fold hydrolase [Shewanella colwelliana]